MTRLSIDFIEGNAAFAAQSPRTGVVVRLLPSNKQRSWQLLRLESPFEYRGGRCEWLLMRSWDAGIEREGSAATSVEVLLVGDAPQVGDGFDEGSFEKVGEAVARPIYILLSRRQRFWLCFSAIIALLTGAGWYLWYVGGEAPSSFARLIVRLLFVILEGMK